MMFRGRTPLPLHSGKIRRRGRNGDGVSLQTTEDISVRGRVLSALTRMEGMQRRVAIRRLRNEDRWATVDAFMTNLESPDETIRVSAATVLPILAPPPAAAPGLIQHLRSNPTPEVRTACARELVRMDTPEAADAVLAALDDPDEEVVKASCGYLARWGGRPAIEALLQLLAHRSWSVRLRACTALLDLDICNARVLVTLEALSEDLDADAHDAAVRAFDADLEESGGLLPVGERIGTMRELIDRGRRIHSRTVRLAA